MTLTVSIIMPVRNEKEKLRRCLDSISAQDQIGESYEVLVIDGVSDDGTRELLLERSEKDRRLKLFNNPEKIVSKALNIGVKNARGDIIIRLDGHSEYAKDYVIKCLEYLNKTDADNVGGPMRVQGQGYVGKTIEYAHHSVFGLGGGKFHNEKYEGYVDTVYLGAFRKEIFNKVGHFDESLARNQDIEMNARILKAGGKIYLTPEIKSTYYCRENLKGLWLQNYSNGYWNVITWIKHPGALSLRHFIPLLFVASLAILGTLSFISSWAKWLLIIDLGSYIFANLCFSLLISLKRGIRYLPVLPLVFIALHFSYGLGSIWSVINMFRFRGMKEKNLDSCVSV